MSHTQGFHSVFTFISENHKQHEEKYLIPELTHLVCILDFFIKHHFESQTQTQVSHFTPRAGCCHFLPLRLLWRGSVTLTSKLTTGADAHNPVDTCHCVIVTSYLSLKTNQWNFTFSQVPCQRSASPSYGKVRDMEGRSNCLTNKMRWNSLSTLRFLAPFATLDT